MWPQAKRTWDPQPLSPTPCLRTAELAAGVTMVWDPPRQPDVIRELTHSPGRALQAQVSSRSTCVRAPSPLSQKDNTVQRAETP